MSSSPGEKITAYESILGPVLKELRNVIIDVLNDRKSIAELEKALNDVREVRHMINDAENIGFVLGVAGWIIAPFDLTGDSMRDLNQHSQFPPEDEID